MLAHLSTFAALASIVSAAPIASTVISMVDAALTLPNTTQTNNVTYYWQNGVAGACGLYSEDTDLVVGLPLTFYNETGAVSPYCGSYVVIKSLANNETTIARVADASASENILSLSVATWRALNGDGTDLATVDWRFANATETAAAKAALASAALTSSTPAATAATVAATTAATTEATTTYVAPTSSSKAVAPSTSKTSEYTPTTTYQTSTYVAPTTSKTSSTYVQAAATTSKASSSSSSGGSYSGTATWFTQNGVAGACGSVHSDSDYIVAIDSAMWNGGAYCGKSVSITGNGKTISATVADECPTCDSSGSLDLSVGAFTALASTSAGVASITWSFQ